MSKEKRKKLNEQTFGEKVGPILNDIEDALIDHHDQFPGELCGYTNDDFRAAICIFLDVAAEKMWEYHERLELPDRERARAAEWFIDEFRLMVLRYCDIATEKLLK